MLMISYNIVQKQKIKSIIPICDIVRYNSAWFTQQELVKSLLQVKLPRFIDVHENRTKDSRAAHDCQTLVKLADNLHVEWIGISKVESAQQINKYRQMITNKTTKICAKVESRIGVDNIEEIARHCDGIMVDKQDLATDVGSGKKALQLANHVYSYCRINNVPTFELYGVIFHYEHNKKKKVVYTYGVFDLLHSGHVRLLQTARSLGTKLVVGVVRDAAVKQKKGADRPVQSLEQRLRIIGALKCVDQVVVQDSFDPTANLVAINPDVLTKGDDWLYIPGQEWAQSNNKQFVKLPYSVGVSTSRTVRKLKGEG